MEACWAAWELTINRMLRLLAIRDRERSQDPEVVNEKTLEILKQEKPIMLMLIYVNVQCSIIQIICLILGHCRRQDNNGHLFGMPDVNESKLN